jgi:isopenicillin-N N-acyltransferase-like protein
LLFAGRGFNTVDLFAGGVVMSNPHHLELYGDARSRGRTHGGELRREVIACVEFYRGLLGLNEAELQHRAGVFEQLIRTYAPQQAEEIHGIAAGAELPPAHIFAINARSELVPFTAPECTAVCAPQAGLLGQTWDWCEELEDLVTVMSITREDGHRLLTVTEPGIVGKIGLSSAGLGVCLNFLSAPRSSDGVPVHNLLREALESNSLPQARERLRQAGTGRGGNILLAADTGEAVNFEFAGDAVDEHAVGETFVHTNHCLFHPLSAGDMEANSHARNNRALELIASTPLEGLQDMKNVLSDRHDLDAPICAPYHPLFGLNLGTICTVIMDLSGRELHFRMGSLPGAEFTVFSL